VDARRALGSQPGARRGFEDLLGLEVGELGAELAVARLPVRAELGQADGVLHAGVFASVAQSLAVRATAAALAPEGRRAVSLSNQTSFLRPVAGGTVHAVARRRHRGRSTWVWEVECSDDEGRLCALSRLTVAVAG
jgi:uncharacterized protein (TIGR00369 family)